MRSRICWEACERARATRCPVGLVERKDVPGVKMIFAESSKRRSFIGRLEPGTELVGALRDLCVRQRVETGYIRAFGYVRAPEVRLFRPEHRRYVKAPEALDGHYMASSIQGTVSFHQEAREMNVSAVLVHTESEEVASGELLAAEVVSVEFTVECFDDVRLYRDEMPQTGLRGWVMMELVGSEPEEEPVVEEPAPIAEVETDEPIEVKPGDYLEHPRLGLCDVLEGEDEARIAIRLQTGRVVELHRDIVKLETAEERDGRRVFRVAIKRKK